MSVFRRRVMSLLGSLVTSCGVVVPLAAQTGAPKPGAPQPGASPPAAPQPVGPQSAPPSAPKPATDSAATAARGIVSGQVIEKASGQPVPFANVTVVGTRLGARTGLDGRFRISGVPVGVHAVRAVRLGNSPVQIDNVKVQPGTSTTVNFALSPVTVSLDAMRIAAPPPVRATSEDALLTIRKSAPRVSDGISAEAIKRAPGANAGDAIVRVTGVSIVDKKFAVVRGLSERYSNTLLNGVELPSPEPLKKIVPLDLFPASLIQSIVVSKTATPDRPGDFAGGSVEVTTKEFPEMRVAEMSLSMGYGAQSTFKTAPLLPQHGVDFFGFDSGRRRQMPVAPPETPLSPDAERFAEQLPNVWTPAPSRIPPDLGMSASLGGRLGGEESPFGYVTALTYSRKTDFSPNRFSQLVFDQTTGIANQGYVANENTTRVDLGAIVNFAVRLGQSSKLGWKTLYTRNAEELLSQNTGFETYSGPAERLTYQARYITRNLVQTQFTGDHFIGALFQSRFEWKWTRAQSVRDEPEDRSLIYFKQLSDGRFVQAPNNPSPYWFRFLNDKVNTAQLDWGFPLGGFFPDGSRVKLGRSIRTRDRKFDALFFRIFVKEGMAQDDATALPPEQALAPENLGSVFELRREGEGTLPYESDDDVNAWYWMAELPLRSSLRLVGGLRVEDWRLALFQGTRAEPLGETTRRHNRDALWSGNLTWSLTERQNIRLAYARTVARPDPRELSADYYVAITGDCANQGNPNVQRTRVLNSDVRWEFYPNPGELFSLSGFSKHFDRPIAELLSFPGSSACTTNYINIEQATTTGGEIELRRRLGFLPGALKRLSLGTNVTLVHSKAEFRPTEELVQYLRLQGQSNYLVNLNLVYGDPERGFEGSVLLNAFGDRIVRYGIASLSNGGTLLQVPHVMEKGRVTLDAKVQRSLGRGVTASLSGRNLTDAEVLFYQGSDVGRVRTGYQRPGSTLTLGLGYAIR